MNSKSVWNIPRKKYKNVSKKKNAKEEVGKHFGCTGMAGTVFTVCCSWLMGGNDGHLTGQPDGVGC